MNLAEFLKGFIPHNSNPFILGGFFLYLLAILIIGIQTCRRNKSQEDFFLAGRSLGPWVTAFSERASGESSWLLLGLPGMGLVIGMGEIWTCLGCIAGIIFSWYIISYKLRVDTEMYQALTLPEYFTSRTGDSSRIISVVSSLIIVFFFTFYVSAQFSGAGKVLNVTFGISHTNGVLIGALFILFYTIMGGFLAVAWTDLIQGIIMIGTLVILPLAGLVEIYSHHGSITSSLNQSGTNLMHLFNQKSGWLAMFYVLGGLSWGLGYMGQPHLLSRFMAIRNPEKLRQSRSIAIAWAIPAFFGALAIGLVGASLYGSGLFDDPEKIMPYMATQLLPGWVAGIFISGAIAAMMSTADSQLIVATSAITEDFFHSVFKITLSPGKMVLLSRLTVLAVGVVAMIMGLKQKDLVFKIVSYAWSGLGASFGPALLLSLYWKRTSKAGVLAGMLTGSLGTIIWSRIAILDAVITHRLASWVLAIIAVTIFSLAIPPRKIDPVQ
jgi:sodium/proline symporter